MEQPGGRSQAGDVEQAGEAGQLGDAAWSGLAPGDDPRRHLAPEAWSAFASLGVAAWSGAPRHLLALSRARVAQLLGYVGGPGDPDDDVPAAQHEALTRWPTDPVFDRTERAVLALTEQFIIDVSGVSDEQRAALGECLPPEQIGAFVMGLYVCDYDLRHAMVLSRLFSGSDLVRAPVPPATSDAGEDAAACFNTFLRTVALMDRIDPVTTEVVRLKGARTHNCRICQSRRSAPAVDGGADESLFAKIGGPGERDLSLRLRTALGLAEAMVTQPASLSAPLADEIRRQFAASEVVELVYDIVRNSSQKAAVALAADAPVVEQGVEYFDIDQLGDVRAGLPTPLAVG